MKNTLIIQFRTDGTITDYDDLIGFEDALIQGYEQNRSGMVDGHDFGNGYMNIFIFPSGSWGPCIDIAIAYVKRMKMQKDVVIIKRLKSGRYRVAWPPNFTGEFEQV